MSNKKSDTIHVCDVGLTADRSLFAGAATAISRRYAISVCMRVASVVAANVVDMIGL